MKSLSVERLVRALAALLCVAVVPGLATSYVSNSAGDWATPTIWTPNGLPGASDNVTINHAVTMAAAQSVNAITIGASGSFAPGAGINLNVAGDWTNNGTFIEGTSTVTFNDSSTIGGSSTHQFYTVNVTGNLRAPTADMTVKGDWNCTGKFRHGAGRMVFCGSSLITGGAQFLNVDINNTSDGNVTVTGGLNVGESLKVISGTLLLGTNTLTLGGVIRTGELFVSGTFSVLGTGPTATGKVVAATAGFPYELVVLPGGTIAARYAEFTGMDTSGVVISSGALVDAADNFSNCAFDHGAAARGPMLKIENDQVIDDMADISFTGTAGSNIEKLGATGHVTVNGGSGNRWGDDFESDPNSLVDWEGGGVEEALGVAARATDAATVVRGVLRLPVSLFTIHTSLFDMTGRQVMALHPGANDVSHLALGVYLAKPSGESLAGSQKFVVQR